MSFTERTAHGVCLLLFGRYNAAMAAEQWEFWIDVGGTFTDCLAKSPDGIVRRHKLLSSGATKGRAESSSTRETIVDPARRNDPDGFWTGWQLAILDADGIQTDSAEVVGFDRAASRLRLRGLSARRPSRLGKRTGLCTKPFASPSVVHSVCQY